MKKYIEEDEGGIAIRNQIYDCNSGNLVTEEAEHRDYGTKANFYREGIRLTELSRYVMQGSLLIQNQDFNYLLSIFKLWEEHHNSLPGSKSYGHSWSGWISTGYFEAGSDNSVFCTNKTNKREKKVKEFEESRKDAEKKLNEELKEELVTPTLDAKITRFELELKYGKGGTTALLTERDIAALKDFIPLYSKRRKMYA